MRMYWWEGWREAARYFSSALPSTGEHSMTDYRDLSLSTRWLHGPGPSDCHPRVLRVMATPAIGYADPDFLRMLGEEQSLLREVFQTQNPLTLLMSGTGTSGMEACFGNLI